MSVRSGAKVYEDHLRRLFGLQPLDATSAHAPWAVRALFMPEFHPEVAITAQLDASDAMAAIEVHSAQRSVWKHMSEVSKDAAAAGNESAEPEIVEERLQLPAAKLAELAALAAEVLKLSDPAAGRGISGLNILLEIAPRDGKQVWAHPVRLGLDRAVDKLCVALLERATDAALWQQSKQALTHVRSYVR